MGTSTPSYSTSQSSGGGGSTAASIATTFLESGMGIVPMIGGLLGLFGGGGSTPPTPEKYQMPSSILFESADVGGTLIGEDYDQMGLPRVYTPNTGGTGQDSGSSAGTGSNGSGTGSVATPSGNGAAPQITLNVQAMDAQSFLDRSNDIAQAVRSAMLNMNSINDVINEV